LGGATAPSNVAAATAQVRDLGQVMEATSICGLGRTAAKPLLSFLSYFSASTTSQQSAGTSMPPHAGEPTKKADS
jgi:NADH:ubiquinone oxidoreductase subunit F (NADH-binding)